MASPEIPPEPTEAPSDRESPLERLATKLLAVVSDLVICLAHLA